MISFNLLDLQASIEQVVKGEAQLRKPHFATSSKNVVHAFEKFVPPHDSDDLGSKNTSNIHESKFEEDFFMFKADSNFKNNLLEVISDD